MSLNGKKKRVALVGKATVSNKKKKNSEDDDIVTEIIRTMNDKNLKYSNKKVEAYQSMVPHRNYNKASGSRIKSDMLGENLSHQDQSQLSLNQSKKVFFNKKPPLMAKCQKNLNYLKHNRAIPKQRAHIGTLQMSSKKSSTKTQVRKIPSKETVPNSKDNKTRSGNIWMVKEMNNRLLESSDSSEEETIAEEEMEPLVPENAISSGSDSDFESFIKYHKNSMPCIPANSSSKKGKKSRKLKKVELKETTSKLRKKRVNLKLFDNSAASSLDDNSSPVNNDSDVGSGQSESDNNLQDETTIVKQIVNCNQSNETSQSLSDKVQFASDIHNCSVKLKRMPAFDHTAMQESSPLHSSEKNSNLFVDEITGRALEIIDSDEDDCVIVDEVPRSCNGQGSVNKPYCSVSDDKSVLPGPEISISNDLGNNGSVLDVPPIVEEKLSETVCDGDSYNSSEVHEDLVIQISSVTSLVEDSSEHMKHEVSNAKKQSTHSDLQNSKGQFDRLNCNNTREESVTGFIKDTESCSEINKASYQLPENKSLVNIDELLSKIDFESIKKVTSTTPERFTDDSYSKIIGLSDKNQPSDSYKLNENKIISSMNSSSASHGALWNNSKVAVDNSTEESNFNAKVSETTNIPSQFTGSITQQNYAECSSDELDAIAASSIEELCCEPEPNSIMPLFQLYIKESDFLSKIKSAGQNASVAVKMMEKGQATKVKLLEKAIENYCRRDPCFYKMMVDRNFIKPKTLNKEGTSKIFNSEPNVLEVQSPMTSKQKKPPCENCGKVAVIKCTGCLKSFYCSENCGMSYYWKAHHLVCSKKFIMQHKD